MTMAILPSTSPMKCIVSATLCRRPHLGEHRQVGVEPVGEALGELDAARVGRDRDQLGFAQAPVLEVVGEDGDGRHMVDGDLEEALPPGPGAGPSTGRGRRRRLRAAWP